MFIVFSGISGSGKNTIIKELLKIRPSLRVLEKSTCTTRAPRDSDKEYNTYEFVSFEDFERGIEQGKFYEYENVHGNYYGTIRSRLESVIGSEYDYVRDIDVKGNVNLKKFFAGKCPMVSVFIDVPDDILRERLLKRGDDPENIEKRLSRGSFEREYKSNYDLVVENIDLNETVMKINDFLNKVTK